MDTSKLRVNGARLRASLEEMAKIGATPAGGVRGGDQKIFTAGLNWYPNSVIKFQFDYEHIEIGRIIGGATAVAGVGTPPATFTAYPQISAAQANTSANQTINAVAIRAQISL